MMAFVLTKVNLQYTHVLKSRLLERLKNVNMVLICEIYWINIFANLGITEESRE